MRNLIACGALALATTLGSFAGAGIASAQGIELQIGPDGIKPVQRDRDRDRRDDRRDARRGGCSERDARRAARQEGLSNVEVVRSTSRSVTVEGDTRRGVERLRFANQRGCPLI